MLYVPDRVAVGDVFFREDAMEYRALSRYRSELMGIAMLWVMCFHASDLDLGFRLLDFVRSAGFGGVDIFILLSAMGLVMSREKKPKEYGAFLRRRARRILPAYYVVMVPYTLFLVLVKDVPWSALLWNGLLLNYWVHCAGSFNWYVSGAMTFYAVTPFFHGKLKAARSREAMTALWITVSLLVCQLLMQEGYWQYMDVFYRFGVFFLGLLLGFYITENRKVQKGDILFWAVLLCAGIAYLAASLWRMGHEDFALYLPMCHLFLFTTVPMCLILCAAFERLPLGWLQKPLRKLGECSLEIYLLNVSVFSEVELLRRLISFGPSNRLYYLVMFAVNIALGTGLHRFMQYLLPDSREKTTVR